MFFSFYHKELNLFKSVVIGEQALEKYRQEAEERIREKLNENLSEERHLYKAEKRRAVELSLQKYRERYKKCVLDMKLRFRQKLEVRFIFLIFICISG